MPRFLRYLLLHLLVLTSLLWLGWRYARLSDREVMVFAATDKALVQENELHRFENRALRFHMEAKAEATHLSKDFHRRDVVRQIYRTVDAALVSFQQLEDALIKQAGNGTASRYEQPRAEAATLWMLIFDEVIQQRIDSLDKKLRAFHELIKAYPMDSSLQQVVLPRTRWQQVRLLGGLPLAGVLAELSRRRRAMIRVEGAALAMTIGREVFSGWYRSAMIIAALDCQRKLVSGERVLGDIYLSCETKPDVALPVVFKGKVLDEFWEDYHPCSRLDFVATMPASGYDEWGRSTQHSQATQQLLKGRYPYHDTTFTYSADYIVTRPRLDVTINHQPPHLYRHCRNRLHLYHQMPPPAGTPTAKLVRVTGGHLLPTTTLPELDVVADQPQVQVTVLDPFDGSIVRTETFATEEPPAPTLRLWSGDSAVALRRGIAAGTRALRVQAEADAWFAAALPQEARYRVAARATLYRRGRAVGQPETLSAAKPELRILPTLARPGDWYVIEATRVERLDGEGKAWPVAVRGEWVVPVN